MLFISASSAWAESLVPKATYEKDGQTLACNCQGSHPAECNSYCTGDYSLNDIVGVAKNLSNIILGIIGSIVLLFFIYGGVVMLTSAGNKERVTKGRRIIVGALAGLAIIFLSYSIIYFISKTIGVTNDVFTTKH